MPVESTSASKATFVMGTSIQVVGTLIALGIAALIGVVAKVSVGDLLLYGGVPVLLVGLLVLGVSLRRAVGNKVANWETWLADTNQYLTYVGDALRRLHLQDVIAAAEANGWKVLDAGRSLEFESPEGEDEVFVVSELAPDPSTVAKGLNNLSPHHFPEKWVAPSNGTAKTAYVAAARVEDLSKQVTVLETGLEVALRALPRELMKLRLADVLPQARNAGWADDWGKDQVVLSRADLRVPISYSEPASVDLDRVRILLGLDPLAPDQGGGPGLRPSTH